MVQCFLEMSFLTWELIWFQLARVTIPVKCVESCVYVSVNFFCAVNNKFATLAFGSLQLELSVWNPIYVYVNANYSLSLFIYFILRTVAYQLMKKPYFSGLTQNEIWVFSLAYPRTPALLKISSERDTVNCLKQEMTQLSLKLYQAQTQLEEREAQLCVLKRLDYLWLPRSPLYRRYKESTLINTTKCRFLLCFVLFIPAILEQQRYSFITNKRTAISHWIRCSSNLVFLRLLVMNTLVRIWLMTLAEVL